MGKRGTQTDGSACTATYDHDAAILVSLHSAVCGLGHVCSEGKEVHDKKVAAMIRILLYYVLVANRFVNV